MTEKVKITSARDLLGDVQDAATNAEKLRQITLLTHHEDREDQDRWERHAEARSSAQELGLISRRLTDLFRDRPEDEHAGGRTYRGSRKGHCLAEVTVSFRSRDGETVTDQLSARQELLNRPPGRVRVGIRRFRAGPAGSGHPGGRHPGRGVRAQAAPGLQAGGHLENPGPELDHGGRRCSRLGGGSSIDGHPRRSARGGLERLRDREREAMARKFVYDNRDFGDPYPDMSVDQVRKSMADFYGDLNNASITESKDGDDTVYTFNRRVGTKGLGNHRGLGNR